MPRTSVKFRGVSVYVEYVKHFTQIGYGPEVEGIEWLFINQDLEALILSDEENDAILEQLRNCDEGKVNP